MATKVKNSAVVLVETAISLEKKGLEVWQQTAQVILDLNLTDDLTSDAKQMTSAFYEYMSKHAGKQVPVRGEDRKGNEIDLRKDEGSIKWSAWSKTARICQNTNEITKCIASYDLETVFPNGQILPRNKIVELNKDAKEPETAIKSIERAVNLIEQKMPEVLPEDITALGVLVQKIMTSFSGIHVMQMQAAAQMKVIG